MRAAILNQSPGQLEIQDVSVSKPKANEVLIQTKASGLCHSDLHVIDGQLPTPLPSVLGHEAAGIVLAVGEEVIGLDKGDHVVTCLTMYCGNCSLCQRGRNYLCTNRQSMETRTDGSPRLTSPTGEMLHQFTGLGGFAEEMLVHQNAVVKIDPELPLDKAALLGCGVLTGFGSVARGAKVEPGSSVAVIGCGGIGLNIIQSAKLAGASQIIAVDLHATKLEMATTFGATDLVNATDNDPVAAVRELTSGGVAYAFEAIGTPLTARQAFEMAAPGQQAYIVGLTPLGSSIEIPGTLMTLQAKGIQGLFMGMSRFKEDIPMLATLFMRGRIKLEELVSERISLEQVNEGYEIMRSGTQARSLIIFD